MKGLNVFAVVVLLLASACSNKEKFEDRPLKDIYESAFSKLQKGDFDEAGEEFLEVDRQYPYSAWAARSILMASFCYYKGKKFDEASRNLEVFVKFNTGHQHVDYAYYLLSLCSLRQVTSSTRDMEKALEALNSFRILVRKYPQSKYLDSARKKIIYLNNLIAAHEMNIGRFYASGGNFIAAIDRYKNVIQFYFNTPHLPEAYFRVIESLYALGLHPYMMDVFSKMPKIEQHWYAKSEMLMRLRLSHGQKFSSKQQHVNYAKKRVNTSKQTKLSRGR